MSDRGRHEDMIEPKRTSGYRGRGHCFLNAVTSVLLGALTAIAISSVARAQATPQPAKEARPAKHSKKAAPAEKPRIIPITINKGETYTISGLEKGATTSSKAGKNPNALTVQPQPSGDIVLLGTEGGSWKINATLANGEKVVYDVKVKAGAPPINSLNPGRAPASIAP
jgi:hypothetical protein